MTPCEHYKHLREQIKHSFVIMFDLYKLMLDWRKLIFDLYELMLDWCKLMFVRLTLIKVLFALIEYLFMLLI